eukprot:CAMPEP_0174267090 /NCGR_PEP_ID=MMETSP0439-20130205/32412_1 /TAXON_ID=0 /ORGANISM="Stereomyxa ramosa, Strain Chinc5" /LENGTH=467 /DNA_ID=CAMNT_0015354401 /DNA_START=128 /DNA_END=1528 /DNA_ORIENTATION=-
MSPTKISLVTVGASHSHSRSSQYPYEQLRKSKLDCVSMRKNIQYFKANGSVANSTDQDTSSDDEKRENGNGGEKNKKKEKISVDGKELRKIREKIELDNSEVVSFCMNWEDSVFGYEFPREIIDVQHLDVPERNKKPVRNVTHVYKKVPKGHEFNARATTSIKDPVYMAYFTSDEILVSCSEHDIILNEQGYIQGITKVQWLPNSTHELMASTEDGHIFILDINRVNPKKIQDLNWGEASEQTDIIYATLDHGEFGLGNIKSEEEKANFSPFSVELQLNNCNPVARWNVCEKSITDFSFSPCGKYVATVGRDGYLRVFNLRQQRLLSAFRSYYASFLCVEWSPDSKYVVTGGEDDLVSLFDPFEERTLLLWGQGHKSWVTGVKFDPWMCDPSQGIYRFASFGQDCRLLIWDVFLTDDENSQLKQEDTTKVETTEELGNLTTQDLAYSWERKQDDEDEEEDEETIVIW